MPESKLNSHKLITILFGDDIMKDKNNSTEYKYMQKRLLLIFRYKLVVIFKVEQSGE